MNKKTGEQIDSDIHFDFLNSYTNFIETFSPLLDKAEIYHKNIYSENLINPKDNNAIKLQTINESIEILNNMVPVFFKIAKIIDKLEELHTN